MRSRVGLGRAWGMCGGRVQGPSGYVKRSHVRQVRNFGFRRWASVERVRSGCDASVVGEWRQWVGGACAVVAG